MRDKLHDPSPATVSLLGFFTGHLLAERDHHRAFFELRHRTAVRFVVRTTLRFASAGLAILTPGFVDVVNFYAGLSPRGKHSDSSPADRGMRSVEADLVGWLRVAYTAWPPENQSLAWPSSRYSLAWCSLDCPPSIAVFYSAAVPGDPLLAITARYRWPRLSPPLPQSVHALHPRKSARCN